ncbi:MAG: hypothetical protein MZV64_28535 [Ignavibacteriales bacterium]|nr:hypothetical protein [Ignavibacteriales bacterium]
MRSRQRIRAERRQIQTGSGLPSTSSRWATGGIFTRLPTGTISRRSIWWVPGPTR